MITDRQIEQLREVVEKFELNDKFTLDFTFGIEWLGNVPLSKCLDDFLSECCVITELLEEYLSPPYFLVYGWDYCRDRY